MGTDVTLKLSRILAIKEGLELVTDDGSINSTYSFRLGKLHNKVSKIEKIHSKSKDQMTKTRFSRKDEKGELILDHTKFHEYLKEIQSLLEEEDTVTIPELKWSKLQSEKIKLSFYFYCHEIVDWEDSMTSIELVEFTASTSDIIDSLGAFSKIADSDEVDSELLPSIVLYNKSMSSVVDEYNNKVRALDQEYTYMNIEGKMLYEKGSKDEHETEIEKLKDQVLTVKLPKLKLSQFKKLNPSPIFYSLIGDFAEDDLD